MTEMLIAVAFFIGIAADRLGRRLFTRQPRPFPGELWQTPGGITYRVQTRSWEGPLLYSISARTEDGFTLKLMEGAWRRTMKPYGGPPELQAVTGAAK